jgi:hypothetical protein
MYSRDPYIWSLGDHTIPRAPLHFARLTLYHGIKGAWTVLSLVVGAGVIGVVGWLLNDKTASTLIIVAATAFVFLVLLIGSYRSWLAAARFVPNINFDAQHRADTLRSWLLSRDPAGIVPHYHAGMAQAALIDYDRLREAGAIEPDKRELVSNPQSLEDIEAIRDLFQSAADRQKT